MPGIYCFLDACLLTFIDAASLTKFRTELKFVVFGRIFVEEDMLNNLF